MRTLQDILPDGFVDLLNEALRKYKGLPMKEGTKDAIVYEVKSLWEAYFYEGLVDDPNPPLFTVKEDRVNGQITVAWLDMRAILEFYGFYKIHECMCSGPMEFWQHPEHLAIEIDIRLNRDSFEIWNGTKRSRPHITGKSKDLEYWIVELIGGEKHIV